METRETGSLPCASSAKSKITGAAACPQAANFQAMVQQQQGMANIAAHQAAHDSVAYRVMMGKSAAQSSMSTSVSNEQSPSAGHQAGPGGFYFQSPTQLDGPWP